MDSRGGGGDRFGGGGRGRGGYDSRGAVDSFGGGGGAGGDEYIVQEDTIFVSGMPAETLEADIQSHFGAIGIIKV